MIITSDGDVVLAATDAVEETAAEASSNPAKKLGVTVAVPEYNGQPGTVVMGGAIPPPQSRNEQISPVPGTYQSTLAPPNAITSELVQPWRSVLAVATAAHARRKMLERILIVLVLRG